MSQMADGILKFMIDHLGLGSNVQLDLVGFKVLCSANVTGLNWPTGILKFVIGHLRPVSMASHKL